MLFARLGFRHMTGDDQRGYERVMRRGTVLQTSVQLRCWGIAHYISRGASFTELLTFDIIDCVLQPPVRPALADNCNRY
jgi:hypothetical protein